MKKRDILIILLYILIIEKILQHLLTALFLVINIPGIGTPNIGTNIQISNNFLALLNLIYAAFFGLGIFGIIKKKKWVIGLIIFLAILDIFLEFIFHHFFFITVSVIISVILVIVSILYSKINKKQNKS